jgi:hypothetical protein
MKNFMDSPSSSGAENWAEVVNTTLPVESKDQRRKGLLK